MGAAFGTGTLRDLARDVLEIAASGLRARHRLDGQGQDETVHLAPLFDIAAGAPTQSEHWLARFNGEWRGDVTQIFAEAAI
jgi:glutamate--cysteine ligase